MEHVVSEMCLLQSSDFFVSMLNLIFLGGAMTISVHVLNISDVIFFSLQKDFLSQCLTQKGT